MDGKYTGLNKHIVWVVPGFPKDESDDRCTPYLYELLQFITSNTKLKISVVSLQYPFTNKMYNLLKTPVYPLNGNNKWYRKPMVWRNCLQTLRLIHEKNPIDCLHSFWFGDTTLMAEAFAQKHKIKHIVSLMGQDALSTNRHLTNRRLKPIPVVALSEFHALNFKASTGRNVSAIIPFGINITTPLNPSKEFDIIGVGSLLPVKNYDLWIDVMTIVRNSLPEIKAIIVGDGPELPRLMAKIKNAHLDNNIQIEGNKPRSFALESMRKSKIFLHTSKYEGQGYVFTEAMAAGLHIVSTPVGYAAENERIWKGTEATDIAKKIIELLKDQRGNVTYDVPLTSETFNSYAKFYSGEAF